MTNRYFSNCLVVCLIKMYLQSIPHQFLSHQHHNRTAYCSPLLDVGLPQGTPQDPISRLAIQSLPPTIYHHSKSE